MQSGLSDAGPEAAPKERRPWRSVALPSEHGGWSLTLEPVLLGLLVAWSLPGLALGVAAFVAFVARTPLKLVLVDRWRDRWLPRSRLAARIATFEAAVLIALVVIAVVGSEHEFWKPLAVAGPLVAIELWYDMRSRSRRLVPELAGAIGIGSVSAAIALAAGESMSTSVGLWCVLAARSIAAIPFVRVQIARLKSESASRSPSDALQLVSIVVIVVGWALGAVPLAAVLAVGALATSQIVLVRLPPPRVMVIGVQQTVLGLALIGVTAIALAG